MIKKTIILLFLLVALIYIIPEVNAACAYLSTPSISGSNVQIRATNTNCGFFEADLLVKIYRSGVIKDSDHLRVDKGSSHTFSFTLTSGSYEAKLYHDNYGDENFKDSKTFTVSSYCGDGNCDSGECSSGCTTDCSIGDCQNGNCESAIGENCATSTDCACKSYENCVGGSCQTYCGNNKCDSGETCPQDDCCNGRSVNFLTDKNNCGTCGVRCSSGQDCVAGQCKSVCGNGRCDAGETCPQDNCCSGKTVNFFNNRYNCGSCGNSCVPGYCQSGSCVDCISDKDCEGATSNTGIYECSSDNKGRYEKIELKGGQCVNNRCSGSSTKKGSYESCGSEPCYNGRCGCPESYGNCNLKCVKRGTILIGQPCDCDVQCESGFCKERKCVKTIDVTLSSTKLNLKPGEETIVTLSISSNLNEDVRGSATLKIGSGTEMVDITSTVSECSKNICKISGMLPGRGTDQITVTLRSDSEVTIPISADVSYKVEGQDVQIKKTSSVKYTYSPTKNKITGEVTLPNIPKNYIGIGVIVLVIIIGLIVYFIGKSHRGKSKRKEYSEKDYEDLIEPIKTLLKHGKKKEEFEHKFLEKDWTHKQINKAMKEAKKELKEEDKKHKKKKGKYCVECGKKIEDHHKHCPHCGSKQ